MRLLLLVTLIQLGAHDLLAQRRDDRAGYARPAATSATISPLQTEELPHTGNAVAGGLVGMLVGAVAGAYVGATSANPCGEGMCELGGLLFGFLADESIGIPLGVQVGGGGGHLGHQLLGSAGVMAFGVLAAPVTGGLSLLPVIPLQFAFVLNDAKRHPTRTEAPR